MSCNIPRRNDVMHMMSCMHILRGNCPHEFCLLQQNTHNSVEASEDGLELGSKGRLGSTVLVKPLHESSKGLGGYVGVRGLFSNSIVRSVQLVLVGDSPDLFEVSVDG